MMEICLRQFALNHLAITSPTDKVVAVFQLFDDYSTNPLLDVGQIFDSSHLIIPGKPDQPELVPPLAVKRRAMHTVEGRAIAIHALAHIEFNAINLALDAIWRFPDMPPAYYQDWLTVAMEESYHFSLLNHHLHSLGYQYGDFPAHNSLWEMVEKTKDDVLARMALVPRTMEARGLDAVPVVKDRFMQAKDLEMVKILEIILTDEIGHVEIGNRWFNYLCDLRALNPIDVFQQLCLQYKAPTLKGPFNIPARLLAGFTEIELQVLQKQAIS
jgi:uncharacterized ferritin-like protein (DUF455 family)